LFVALPEAGIAADADLNLMKSDTKKFPFLFPASAA
jgi:hypothetical protein